MNFVKMLILAFVILGVSFEASAKEKKLKPWKDQECRWLQPPTTETCEGRQYARGQVQCAAYAVTGYCSTDKALDANECLSDDSGKTKSCFKKTRAFSDRLKESGKKTRAVTKFPTCAWANDSFLPANDIYVSDLQSATSGVPSDCIDQEFVYRRASCQIDGKPVTPMLFCRVADASTNARDCMAGETDPLVVSCREILEPILSRERYKRMGGSTAAPGGAPQGAKQ